MESILRFVIEKETILPQLINANRELESTAFKSCALDLSNLSLMNSTQLGQLSQIIRITRERSGATLLLTNNEDFRDILDSVRFSEIAEVFAERELFDKRVAEIEAAQPKKQTVEPVRKPVLKKDLLKTALKPVINKKKSPSNKSTLHLPVIFSTLFSFTMTFILTVFFFARIIPLSDAITTLTNEQKKLNTQVNELSKKVEELELLNELSQ